MTSSKATRKPIRTEAERVRELVRSTMGLKSGTMFTASREELSFSEISRFRHRQTEMGYHIDPNTDGEKRGNRSCKEGTTRMADWTIRVESLVGGEKFKYGF